MSWVLALRARSLAVVGAVAGAVLAALAGCAGELDPSLLPGATGSPAGSGGGGARSCFC